MRKFRNFMDFYFRKFECACTGLISHEHSSFMGPTGDCVYVNSKTPNLKPLERISLQHLLCLLEIEWIYRLSKCDSRAVGVRISNTNQ